MLANGLDGAPLAGRVASLEDEDRARAGFRLPVEKLHKLDLQRLQLPLVALLRQLLRVRKAAGGEGILVDPVGKLRIVDIEAVESVQVSLHILKTACACRGFRFSDQQAEKR